MSNPVEYSHNIIKARVAETIIQELFQQNGYHVFNYGMERTIPSILGTIKNQSDAIATAIRAQPDFVVQDSLSGELFYVEVKYRKSGHFNIDDLIDNFPYKNAHFVIVSPENIQAISYSDLERGFSINSTKNRGIESYSFFKLDVNSIILFKKFVFDFFGNQP